MVRVYNERCIKRRVCTMYYAFEINAMSFVYTHCVCIRILCAHVLRVCTQYIYMCVCVCTRCVCARVVRALCVYVVYEQCMYERRVCTPLSVRALCADTCVCVHLCACTCVRSPVCVHLCVRTLVCERLRVRALCGHLCA